MQQLNPQNAGFTQAQMNTMDRKAIDMMNCPLSSAGLVMGTSASTSVKVANTVTYLCGGYIKSKTTAEVAFTTGGVHDIPANASSVQEQTYAIQAVAAGTLSIVAGGISSGAGTSPLPENPIDGVTVFGYVIIAVNAAAPTATTNFVAGTTLLNDARMTVTYLNGRRLSLFSTAQ